MVELQVQPVAAGRRELGLEQQPVLLGVDVEVGEVAVAQGHQVPGSTEVRRSRRRRKRPRKRRHKGFAPVASPTPRLPGLSYGPAMLYLFLLTIPMKAIGAGLSSS